MAEESTSESVDVVSIITARLEEINTAPTSEEVDASARRLAGMIKQGGIIMLKHHGILTHLDQSAKSKSGLERESSMIAVNALADVLGEEIAPILLDQLELVLDLHADKGQVVQEAAAFAAETIISHVVPEAVTLVIHVLLKAMERAKKWQTRVAALSLLQKLGDRAPEVVTNALVQIIPVVSLCLSDTKADVAKAANKTMMSLCAIGCNADIEPHVQDLVRCMGDPTHVSTSIDKLANTTFVAEVDGPTLAIMTPLLERALHERSTLLLRKTLIITDNMCKLVADPRVAAQFLPHLYPGVHQQAVGAAFPEIRALAEQAEKTLVEAGGKEGPSNDEFTLDLTTKVVQEQARKSQGFLDSFFGPIFAYCGAIAFTLARQELFGKDRWTKLLVPFLSTCLLPSDAQTVCDLVYNKLKAQWMEMQGEQETEDDEQLGEPICDVEDFSLAYGTRLLLNHTRLKLYRGQRYGLCGANGAGKTTLMRSIHGGKVEGFPSQDKVRTAFVDYTAQGADTSRSVVDYVLADPALGNVSRADIEQKLLDTGLEKALLERPVQALSGGGKMKVELVRAILAKADVLLLDEPTNHLDVTNVQWLKDYLNSQTNVTCLIVSHDGDFLDNVCTHILHYDRKKLKLYKGNLTKFIEAYPPARSYYHLDASTVSFTFPKPSFLQGVTSQTKVILKTTDCTFTYPGSTTPSLYNASVSLSLSSRVAVVGANGAGKSTLIKLLTGETTPQSGTVWRHPALRIGYIAQHAFHHLEQHLEKTPLEYLQWRYLSGEDKEVHEKETRQWTEDELVQMDKYIEYEGERRQIEYILGRAKLKKSFQYEVKWRNLRHKHNSWLSRDQLLELGFQKLVQQFDDKEASREGLLYRELTMPAMRQHFADVGLDPDLAQFNTIQSLSAGQKVKVVIAGAMWNNSHLLVLDEPTNFLDREALGGLASAIKSWDGAVVMISHSEEFVSALCPELWRVEAGRVNKSGQSAVEDEKQVDDKAVKARLGKKKKKTRNEVKAQQERRRARHLKWLIEGGEREPDTDSD